MWHPLLLVQGCCTGTFPKLLKMFPIRKSKGRCIRLLPYKLLQMEAPKSATWWLTLMPENTENLISSRTRHRRWLRLVLNNRGLFAISEVRLAASGSQVAWWVVKSLIKKRRKTKSSWRLVLVKNETLSLRGSLPANKITHPNRSSRCAV